MIQRWQTLFLILVVIANLLIFNFNLWSGEAVNEKGNVTEEVVLDALSIQYQSSSEEKSDSSDSVIWLTSLTIIATIAALVAILLFNNRRLQLRISRLGMLLEAALIALIFFYVDTAQSHFVNDMSKSGYEFGVFLPMIGVVGFFIANILIIRDERLVKSAERLR